jgi:hypothetical protein
MGLEFQLLSATALIRFLERHFGVPSSRRDLGRLVQRSSHFPEADFLGVQGPFEDHSALADFPVLIRTTPTWITSELPTIPQKTGFAERHLGR